MTRRTLAPLAFSCALFAALLFADRALAGFVQCAAFDACPWASTPVHPEQARSAMSRDPW